MRIFVWLAMFLPAAGIFRTAGQSLPVFRAETNLQSVAVQVSDKHGNHIHGLQASDFILLEDGHPQKIAFFGAESEPVSLAILMDAGRSMDFGGKTERARALLESLVRANRPEDEIFFMPFTDEVGPFVQLTERKPDQLPKIPAPGHGGMAPYDALAAALCHMRTAKNLRQAVVVISDGVDEHSRLRLAELIELVRASSPQVFMAGVYDKQEYQLFQRSGNTIPIVGLRHIDNPVVVFERLAKESGAESFFPTSEQDLKKALDRISALLQAEYTLAYYPGRIAKARKIEVKVKRSGMRISARRSLGSDSAAEAVHFVANGCAVSPQGHPYPWESRVTASASSPVIYQEDFLDERSGWPAHRDGVGEAHYLAGGGYEVSRFLPQAIMSGGTDGFIVRALDNIVAAYGPWWNNFRASASVDAHRGAPAAVGLTFNVNESGYYALLVRPLVDGRAAFELVKGDWNGGQSVLIPPTQLAELAQSGKHKLAVECNRGQITLQVDDRPVGRVTDDGEMYGLVGFGVFGDCGTTHKCSVVAKDLLVKSIP